MLLRRNVLPAQKKTWRICKMLLHWIYCNGCYVLIYFCWQAFCIRRWYTCVKHLNLGGYQISQPKPPPGRAFTLTTEGKSKNCICTANTLRQYSPFPSVKPCLAVFWSGDRCGKTTTCVFLISLFFELTSQIWEKKLSFYVSLHSGAELCISRTRTGEVLVTGFWVALWGEVLLPLLIHILSKALHWEKVEIGVSSIVKENPASTMCNGICFIGDKLKISIYLPQKKSANIS